MKVKVECEDRYKITLPDGKVLNDFVKESEWEGVIKLNGKEGHLIIASDPKEFFESIMENIGVFEKKPKEFSLVMVSPDFLASCGGKNSGDK